MAGHFLTVPHRVGPSPSTASHKCSQSESCLLCDVGGRRPNVPAGQSAPYSNAASTANIFLWTRKKKSILILFSSAFSLHIISSITSRYRPRVTSQALGLHHIPVCWALCRKRSLFLILSCDWLFPCLCGAPSWGARIQQGTVSVHFTFKQMHAVRNVKWSETILEEESLWFKKRKKENQKIAVFPLVLGSLYMVT